MFYTTAYGDLITALTAPAQSLYRSSLTRLFDSFIGQNGDASVDYLEFLAASLGPEDYLDPTNVKAAFLVLDKDGNGKLDYGELVRVLGKIGNENDVQAIIKAVDT